MKKVSIVYYVFIRQFSNWHTHHKCDNYKRFFKFWLQETNKRARSMFFFFNSEKEFNFISFKIVSPAGALSLFLNFLPSSWCKKKHVDFMYIPIKQLNVIWAFPFPLPVRLTFKNRQQSLKCVSRNFWVSMEYWRSKWWLCQSYPWSCKTGWKLSVTWCDDALLRTTYYVQMSYPFCLRLPTEHKGVRQHGNSIPLRSYWSSVRQNLTQW